MHGNGGPRYRFLTCDVFTDRRFGGNPLAVVTDAVGLDDARMQAIAREFNLSETTFVLPPSDPRHAARVRIFTPGGELPFAGHPTVGTAYVLARIGAIPPAATQVRFEEGVGPVPVSIERDRGVPTRCTLTAARRPECGPPAPDAATLARVLSLDPRDIAAHAECWSCGVPFLVVPLASVAALERCRIDPAAYAGIRHHAAGHVYPVARVDAATWRVRMFAPTLGVAEDPATGGAAAAFAGWLARHEPTPGTSYRLLQGVEIERPSRIDLQFDVEGAEACNVRVGGSCVMVSEGSIEA